MNSVTHQLRAARDFLVRTRIDHASAVRDFRWPTFEHFNFALDWFDVIAAERAGPALRIVNEHGAADTLSYPQLASRSAQVANYLNAAGLRRGDAILVMLPNCPALWEIILGAIKLGAVIIPTSTLLSEADLGDRLVRGRARAVVCSSDATERFQSFKKDWLGIAVGSPVSGWLTYDEVGSASKSFNPAERTRSSDPLLLYFTSGTTSKPKLVLHSHASYPIGHLSTMYWIGLLPGDVHLNISSPGWAKHAWSCVFAPWLAEATVLVLNQSRFDARYVLDAIVAEQVTTFCAPPTVWRMLAQQELAQWSKNCLRELVSAGEPLNPEIIDRIRRDWRIAVRDGYGQTETTAQIGNTPGLALRPGAMGRPLPGYAISLRDADDAEVQEGELCIELGPAKPLGLMTGYRGESGIMSIDGPRYRTGDTAAVDTHGNYTYIGRADDVFKSSDYRISPFELESALIEHPAVAEAAVVPSPDPVRLAVPKAFVTLKASATADSATARSILQHSRAALGPFKRLRRIEFCDLPKTISGKIRRVELRHLEAERRSKNERGACEWCEDDFAD